MVVKRGMIDLIGTLRLHRKLAKIQKSSYPESILLMKQEYPGLMNIYSKISQKYRVDYYSRIEGMRKSIISNLRAENHLQKLLQETPKLKSMRNKKENYLKINELLNHLPNGTQSKYFRDVIYLRDSLEVNLRNY